MCLIAPWLWVGCVGNTYLRALLGWPSISASVVRLLPPRSRPWQAEDEARGLKKKSSNTRSRFIRINALLSWLIVITCDYSTSIFTFRILLFEHTVFLDAYKNRKILWIWIILYVTLKNVRRSLILSAVRDLREFNNNHLESSLPWVWWLWCQETEKEAGPTTIRAYWTR